MWKLVTTAKGNFVYVSLLKQQGNSDFEFISVSFSGRYGRLYTLPTYNFIKIKRLEDRIFLFSFSSSFLHKKSIKENKKCYSM